MWVLLWQTRLIAAADAGEEGYDKETWAPLLMTLPRLFGFHIRPACTSAGPGRYQALAGKQDRTV
jgi:hypothetical protein